MKRYLFPFVGLVLLGQGCDVPIVPMPGPGPIACTADAKQCPDGSYVGRVAPTCAFAPCPPAPVPGVEGRKCTGPVDTSCGKGYECIQECGPPAARDTDPAPGYSCHATGQQRMCPICLASNTMIETPNGSMNVRSLSVGMSVWTLDRQGEKIAAPVITIIKTPVPKTHQVIHLVMADGREAWISPNHPTADGRTVGQLKTGDRLDGSVVLSAQSVAYWDAATYDLLPAGDTGAYWANGILMGSTLFK